MTRIPPGARSPERIQPGDRGAQLHPPIRNRCGVLIRVVAARGRGSHLAFAGGRGSSRTPPLPLRRAKRRCSSVYGDYFPILEACDHAWAEGHLDAIFTVADDPLGRVARERLSAAQQGLFVRFRGARVAVLLRRRAAWNRRG